MVERTRRDLIRGALATFLAKGVGIGQQAIIPVEGAEEANVTAALGRRFLDRDAELLAKNFYEARSGTLMAYYQRFWDFWPMWEEDYQRLEALNSLCSDFARDPHYNERRHRMVALPAAAGIHTFASALPDQAKELTERVIEVHRSARDPHKSPNREVLEIIWQNMTAALIRNQWSWRSFRPGKEIIDEAEFLCGLFCRRYVSISSAAIAAWQFLLTYEIALTEHDHSGLLAHVRAARSKIEENKYSPQFTWLRTLAGLYVGRTGFADVLPQLSEVFLGRRSFSGEVVDYFTLVSFRAHYNDHLIMHGNLNEPFLQGARVREAVGVVLTVFGNYRIKSEDWNKAYVLGQRNQIALPEGLSSYVSELFQTANFVDSAHELAEQATAEWIANLIPFRSRDGVELVAAMQGAMRFATETITEAGDEASVVRRAWRPMMLEGARNEADRRDMYFDAPLETIVGRRSEELLAEKSSMGSDGLESQLPVYRRLKEELKWLGRSPYVVGYGISDPFVDAPGEIAASTVNVIHKKEHQISEDIAKGSIGQIPSASSTGGVIENTPSTEGALVNSPEMGNKVNANDEDPRILTPEAAARQEEWVKKLPEVKEFREWLRSQKLTRAAYDRLAAEQRKEFAEEWGISLDEEADPQWVVIRQKRAPD